MVTSGDHNPPVQSDERLPSGPWEGFFLQRELPGRHQMELFLAFSDGTIRGEGRDFVGEFLIFGRYDPAGECYWQKRYLGRHEVWYKGFAHEKGITGNWEIGLVQRGAFQIWPWGQGPTDEEEATQAVPLFAEEDLVPVGALD